MHCNQSEKEMLILYHLWFVFEPSSSGEIGKLEVPELSGLQRAK